MCISHINTVYFNDYSFATSTPVQNIPRDRLLVLDNFAFDINELMDFMLSNPLEFFTNPHCVNSTQPLFSRDAQLLILGIPAFYPIYIRHVIATQAVLRQMLEDAAEEAAMAQGDEAYDDFLANRGPDW